MQTPHDIMKAQPRKTFSQALFTVLLSASAFSTSPLTASPLTLGDGVDFSQISFRDGPNSSVGQITVDRNTVIQATGLSSGFVNVADSSGDWLVRNLPVFSTAQSDARFMTTQFNIPGITDGTPISALNLNVDYSLAPVTNFAGGNTTTFSMGLINNAVGGVDVPTSGYRPGPDLSGLTFDGGLFSLTYQMGHTNVQAANNQCAPAAIANSLTWLKSTAGLPVPDPNIPGLRGAGDKSLVGKLEEDMNRPVTDRTKGSGVWPLDGKLKYLSDAGLGSSLIIEHIGGGGDGKGGVLDGSKNYTSHGITSYGQGSTVSWSWIQRELAHGEDVELEYQYKAGGAHYVDVTGAGTILGVPYITHISDRIQSDKDPTDTLGTGTVQFDFMIGTHLYSENADALQAISQSAVPEPSTYGLAAAALLGMAAVLRRKTRTSRY